MVAITRDNRIHCSGSLISRTHILTAAHCVHNPSYKEENVVLTQDQLNFFELYFGLTNWSEYDPDDFFGSGETRKIKHIHVHPGYKKPQKYHDLAILEVNEDLPFTTEIQPICLPLETSPNSDNRARFSYRLSGFGLTTK